MACKQEHPSRQVPCALQSSSLSLTGVDIDCVDTDCATGVDTGCMGRDCAIGVDTGCVDADCVTG